MKNYLLCNFCFTYWLYKFGLGSEFKCLKQSIYFAKNQFSATWISFLKLDLLKFEDEIHLENVLLISKHINNLLPPVFDKWFTFCSNIHNYETVLVNFSNHLPKQIPMRKLQLQ